MIRYLKINLFQKNMQKVNNKSLSIKILSKISKFKLNKIINQFYKKRVLYNQFSKILKNSKKIMIQQYKILLYKNNSLNNNIKILFNKINNYKIKLFCRNK